MDAALFQCSVVREDRRVVSRTLLLNTNRVEDFYADPSSGRTVFFYRTHDSKFNSRELQYDGNVQAFKLLLRETEKRDDITINVTHINKVTLNIHDKGGLTSTLVDKLSMNVENFVAAEDDSAGTNSYVWISRAGRLVCYKSTDLIDKIDNTASASGSINI